MTVVVVSFQAAAVEGEPAFVQELNTVYGEVDGIGLLMDVFSPTILDAEGTGLGIVCVTSGAWKSDRAMVNAHIEIGLFDVLCGRGYTVFAIRPGSVSLFTAPEMLAHIKLGIRHVKANARKYGIDANRLGMAGVSAGGHLACLAATRADSAHGQETDPLGKFDTQVQAVAVFCPPTDFLDWDGQKYGLDLMQWRLVFRGDCGEKSETEKDQAARDISPVYFVQPGLPPFLFVHGDADSLVPIQQSRKMVDALKAQGVAADLIVKEGGDHSWPGVREEIEKMADWFDATLAAADSPLR